MRNSASVPNRTIASVLFLVVLALFLLTVRATGQASKPARANLEGKWYAAASKKTYLVFYKDGSFKAVNLPDRSRHIVGKNTYSGSGKWSMDSERTVSLNFTERNARKIIRGVWHDFLYLDRAKKPRTLYFYIGDPDEGKTFDFKRL